MINNAAACITETLKWEGGYSNNAADPGGPTNWGITIIDAKKYWKKDATAADVKAMPKTVAIDIYQNKYWKTSSYDCNTLPAGVDLVVFDFGVNSGPARAKKYLDLCTGKTPQEIINQLCDKRLAFLKGLKTWSVFGKGWGSRVAGIRSKALQMASQSPSKGTGAAAGIGLATMGAATAAPHHYLPWIVGIGFVLAIVAFVAFEAMAYKE